MDDDLRTRLELLEARNRRVDADKTWERSWVRRLSVAALTYVVLGVYMTVIDVGRPWLNAVVPTAGYLLSTFALEGVRRLWARRRRTPVKRW